MQTKIILEMGCNHNGDFDIAKQMIDDACDLGVWGVKFQKRDIDSIPLEIQKKPRDIEKNFGTTYREHREALEFTKNQMFELQLYAEKSQLKFGVSVFDKQSIFDMIEIGCEYIKLPSQLSSNKQLVSLIKNKKSDTQKIILSTGMHTLDEIYNDIIPLEPDILLYCRSIYPCDINQIHYGGFCALKKKCKNIQIGYSSHDKEGIGVALIVLLGTEYIERHYTISKKMKGHDHGTVSSDYKEMKQIIDNIKKIEEIIDPFYFYKELLSEEKIVRKTFRGF